MGKIIDLNSYRNQRRQQRRRLVKSAERARRSAGFDFGIKAFRIMQEEMGQDRDPGAVYYAVARLSLSSLRKSGFTHQEIQKLIQDINE
jgi:isopenicillin N synthase-like dioxygenase